MTGGIAIRFSNQKTAISVAFLASVVIVAYSIFQAIILPLNDDAAYYLEYNRFIFHDEVHLTGDGPHWLTLLGIFQYVAYMPTTALTDLTGLSDQFGLLIQVYGQTALSVWLIADYLTSHHLDVRWRWLLVPAFLLLVLVWPTWGLAERDNIFTIMVTPYLLARAAAIEGSDWPGRKGPLIAVMAGLSLLIKVHYALLWVMIEAVVMIKRRNVKMSFDATNAIIMAIIVVYYGWYVIFFMANPEVAAQGVRTASIYSNQIRPPFEDMFIRKQSILWVLLGLALAIKRPLRAKDGLATILLTAIAAALAWIVILHQNIDYQWYPIFVPAGLLMAWCGGLGIERRSWMLVGVLALYLGLSVARIGSWVEVTAGKGRIIRDVAAGMAKAAPPGGRAICLCYAYTPFFPAINMAGMRLGSLLVTLWPTNDVAIRRQRAGGPTPDSEERWNAIIDTVVTDAARWRPDLILASPTELQLYDDVMADSRIQAVLADYEKVDSIESATMDIYRRRP